MQNTAASLFTSSTKGCHLHLIFCSFPVCLKVIYSYGKYLQSLAKVLNECTFSSSLAPIHRNSTKRQRMKGEKQRCEVNSKASDKAQLSWVRHEGLYQHHTPWPCESKDSGLCALLGELTCFCAPSCCYSRLADLFLSLISKRAHFSWY